MNPIAFTVVGLPAPQGSKRPFRNQHTGRISLVESSDRHKDWRALVSLTAAENMSGDPFPHHADLNLAAVFRFPRPRSHYGNGKNAGRLKPSATPSPRKPDLSKLVRSVEDAMTGIVWVDDDQVVSYDGTRKVWCERWESPGVHIVVTAAQIPRPASEPPPASTEAAKSPKPGRGHPRASRGKSDNQKETA